MSITAGDVQGLTQTSAYTWAWGMHVYWVRIGDHVQGLTQTSAYTWAWGMHPVHQPPVHCV